MFQFSKGRAREKERAALIQIGEPQKIIGESEPQEISPSVTDDHVRKNNPYNLHSRLIKPNRKTSMAGVLAAPPATITVPGKLSLELESEILNFDVVILTRH